MAPQMKLRKLLSYDEVMARVDALRLVNTARIDTRSRIRAIMRGGPEAVDVLLGSKRRKRDADEYLQAVNLLASSSMRLGQDLGLVPDIKTSTTPGEDGARHRHKAGLVESIVSGYDERDGMDRMLAQWGRWVPGYGYGFAFVGPSTDPYTEHTYPKVHLRNSFDVWPGWWGPDSEPCEAACVRLIDLTHLGKGYSLAADEVVAARRARSAPNGRGFGASIGNLLGINMGATVRGTNPGPGQSWWEGAPSNAAVLIEYFDESGRYLIVPEADMLIDIIPNPLPTTFFVMPRRIDFDELAGQWDHAIGIQMMIAKLSILSFVAAEDSVFAPWNIIGDPTNKPLNFGRRAVNRFPAGTQVQRGFNNEGNMQFTWQQLSNIERHARIQLTYPVSEDGQSPNSFATGRAITELSGSVGKNVAEYQMVFSRAVEKLDTLRLAWDQIMYPGTKKPIESRVLGEKLTTTYDPADIGGRFNTTRKYGVMATWDDNSKIVAGLQLHAAGIIDTQTMRENLQGLDSLPRIEERQTRERMARQLEGVLGQMAASGDPAAAAVLAQIMEKPLEVVEIIAKWLDPDEQAPQPSPEEEALMAGGAQVPEGPPNVTSILSRLELSGNAEGGVQTVATPS